MTKFFAGLAALAVLVAPTFAVAAGEGAKKLSRADFDACNQQAMMIAGVDTGVSPSASPATERDRATTPGTTGSPSVSPSPGTSGTDSSTTGTGAGASGTTGAGTSGAAGSGLSGTTGGGSSMSGSAGSGTTGTGVSGSGMSGTGASHERAGQHADLDKIVDAYRDCLQARK